MRLLALLLLLILSPGAFAQASAYQNCPNGKCPVTPLRTAAAAVVQAAPVRSAMVATARVAVAPVRYVNEHRPRLFQRFVHRVRCR